MIKLFSTLLLGVSVSAFANAQKPNIVSPVPNNVVKKGQIVESNVSTEENIDSSFLIKNSELTKNLPTYMQDWKKYVLEKNIDLTCPQKYSIINCVFVNKSELIEDGEVLKLKIIGHSFAEGFLEQPIILNMNEKNIWAKKILLNNKIASLIEKEEKSYVEINKGDFVIEIILNKNQIKNLKTISFNDNAPIIFENKIKNKNFIKEENVITAYSKTEEQNKEKQISEKDINNEILDINVYRKLNTSVPNVLSTKLKITYSGKEVKKSLGKVLPDGFVFNQANSNLNIEYKNNEFFVTLKNGEHLINIESFSFENLESINVESLVPSANQEIWSIEQNSNLRQVNIVAEQSVDPNQGNVPQEWRKFPSYLVKNNLKIKNERQGVEENNKVKITINRKSYYGFSDGLWTNFDNLNVNNMGSQILYKNNDESNLENFSVLQQDFGPKEKKEEPQSILKIDNKNGVLIPQGNFEAQSQSNSEQTSMSPNIYAGENIFSNWDVYLAPRLRAITAYGDGDNIKTTNTWSDNWNLYVMFSLFIITLIYYKLFGKKIAAMAFVGIVIFNTQFFAWPLWTAILVSLGILKLLPNKENSKFAKHVFNFGLIFLALTVMYGFSYIVSEIQAIVNPSIELIKNRKESMLSYFNNFLFILLSYFLIVKLIDIKNDKTSIFMKVFSSALYFVGFSIVLSAMGGFFATGKEGVFGSSPRNLNTATMRTIEENYPNAPAEADMMSKSMVPQLSSLAKKEKFDNDQVKEKIYTKKVQVGSGKPNVESFVNNYFSIENKTFVNGSNINILIAPIWLVNVFGLFQIGFLVLSLLLFTLGLLLLSNDKKWFNRIPKVITQNKYVNYLIVQELEKGLKK